MTSRCKIHRNITSRNVGSARFSDVRWAAAVRSYTDCNSQTMPGIELDVFGQTASKHGLDELIMQKHFANSSTSKGGTEVSVALDLQFKLSNFCHMIRTHLF